VRENVLRPLEGRGEDEGKMGKKVVGAGETGRNKKTGGGGKQKRKEPRLNEGITLCQSGNG